MKNLLLIVVSVFLAYCSLSPEKAAERARIEREKFVADSIAEEQLRIEILRADSITQAEHESEVKNSIKITSYYTSRPNSAGGVDVHFTYKNLNDKVIKYLSWQAFPVNAVDDVVSCSIRGRSLAGGKDTGPIKKGQSSDSGYWDCVWYNYTIKKMILTKVTIEYMDGSIFEIIGDDLYLIGAKR